MKICRIFGIDIYLDISWWIALIIFGWMFQGMFVATFPKISIITSWIFGVLLVLGLFTSVLIHELAHALVAKKNKLLVSRITLLLFGGMAHLEKEPERPGADFWIAIVGPFLNFVLASVFYGLIWLLGMHILTSGTPSSYLNYFKHFLGLMFSMNLLLGIFNLLPGFPMDGGRVLRAILWKTTRSFLKATKWAARVGQAFAVLMVIGGILEMVSLGAFDGLWLIFIGIMIFFGARQSYKEAKNKNPD